MRIKYSTLRAEDINMFCSFFKKIYGKSHINANKSHINIKHFKYSKSKYLILLKKKIICSSIFFIKKKFSYKGKFYTFLYLCDLAIKKEIRDGLRIFSSIMTNKYIKKNKLPVIHTSNFKTDFFYKKIFKFNPILNLNCYLASNKTLGFYIHFFSILKIINKFIFKFKITHADLKNKKFENWYTKKYVKDGIFFNKLNEIMFYSNKKNYHLYLIENNQKIYGFLLIKNFFNKKNKNYNQIILDCGFDKESKFLSKFVMRYILVKKIYKKSNIIILLNNYSNEHSMFGRFPFVTNKESYLFREMIPIFLNSKTNFKKKLLKTNFCF